MRARLLLVVRCANLRLMQPVNPYAQEDYAALVQSYDNNITRFRDFLDSTPATKDGELDVDTLLKVCKSLPDILKARNAIYLMASGKDADDAEPQAETPMTAAQMIHDQR